MRRRVDAAREARDDRDARRAEIGGELAGHARAERGGRARADQGHHRPRHNLLISLDPEHGRRVGKVGERLWIGGLAPAQKPRPGGFSRLAFRMNDTFRAGRVVADAGGPGDPRQRLERRRRRPVFLDQPPEGRGADPAGANETEPRQSVIFRGRWGEGGGVRKQTFVPRAFASFARADCSRRVNQWLRFAAVPGAARKNIRLLRVHRTYTGRTHAAAAQPGRGPQRISAAPARQNAAPATSHWSGLCPSIPQSQRSEAAM